MSELQISLVGLIVLLTAAACAGTPVVTPRQPAPTPSPLPPTAPSYPPEAQVLVEQAVADLSRRTQIPASDIRLLGVEGVQWPDSCLGCAKPGEMCLMVITPGYRIGLQAGGRGYDYHTSMQDVILCE